jgi:hypothetical protein
MTDRSDTESGAVTLAFSLSAIERIDHSAAAFDEAAMWSGSFGIIDDDTDRIERIVAEYDLRQDYDIADRDKWFLLKELCEAESTPRHVYVGASDADMGGSTILSGSTCASPKRPRKRAGRSLSPVPILASSPACGVALRSYRLTSRPSLYSVVRPHLEAGGMGIYPRSTKIQPMSQKDDNNIPRCECGRVIPRGMSAAAKCHKCRRR